MRCNESKKLSTTPTQLTHIKTFILNFYRFNILYLHIGNIYILNIIKSQLFIGK